MDKRRWSIVGLVIAVAIAAAIAWLVTDRAGPQPAEGVVRVPANLPVPAPAPRAAPAVAVKRMPTVSTEAVVKVADEQSFRVTYERRDQSWASRSETAIASLMRTIPYVGGRRRLEIKCASTACEVNGIVDLDPATGTYGPVWEALERDTAGDQLLAHGLERVSTIFDSGREPEAFKIAYRRII